MRRALCLFLCCFLSLSGADKPLRLMDLDPVQAQMETLGTNIFHLLVRGLLLYSVCQTRLWPLPAHSVLTQYTMPPICLLEHSGFVKGNTYCTLRNYERLACCTHLCSHSCTEPHRDTHSRWGRAELATLSVMHYFDVQWTLFKEK